MAMQLEELALMLQWQWTLRRKGWQDKSPSIELAAAYQAKRVTLFMRRLRRAEPWLQWNIVEGTEDIVECTSLGIRCVPPPAKPWVPPTVPVAPVAATPDPTEATLVTAVARTTLRQWCPVVPPNASPSEAGRPRGGRFLEL